MTIVLVILAVLILLAVLFLIFHVSKLSKAHRELITDYYSALTNRFLNLNDDVNKQINATITTINDARTDVVRLANKVEESNTSCKNGIDALKHTIGVLDARLTAPIDKINDTHNRIKTLGKSAASADDLRAVIADVVSAIATEAVDSVCKKCAPKPKTTKKVTKEPIKEGKL